MPTDKARKHEPRRDKRGAPRIRLTHEEVKIIQAYRDTGELSKEPDSYLTIIPTAQKLLLKSAMTPASLQKSLGCTKEELTNVLNALDLHYSGGMVSLTKPESGKIDMKIFGDTWHTFGLVADTHLASNTAREDALHAVYDIFEKEGIKKVFHAGNMVDGYVPRINGSEVICSSIDDQTQYVIDNYPKKEGITTYYITGDDHEGWWQKEGFNWGKHLELMCEDQGRHDLQYIGHVEGDVELINSKGGKAIMKIQHPGGGSSYARSYTAQKTIEAFEGAEKPQILVQGHYHVSNYMQDRNVHVVGMPGFQDQTIFARKKRLRMEIGGAIMKFKQNPEDGSITRFSIEFIRFFNRGYYRRFLKSDSKAVKKGHLTIKS